MTKQKEKKFTPFLHENLELKNGLIIYARELKGKQGFENLIASAFIYISFVEYLAEFILEHLRYFVYQASYRQYAAIIFIDERNGEKNKTLGQFIHEIRKYDFPDKVEIIRLFDELCKLRNDLFHNFARSDASALERIISEDLIKIQEKAEELLEKINIVTLGLQKVLTPQETVSSTENVSTTIDSKESETKDNNK